MERDLLLEYLYEIDCCSHEELKTMTTEQLQELVDAYETEFTKNV